MLPADLPKNCQKIEWVGKPTPSEAVAAWVAAEKNNKKFSSPIETATEGVVESDQKIEALSKRLEKSD